MNILLLGSGGRECAIAWKLAQHSDMYDELFIAPGNAGTRLYGTNVNISAGDFDAIRDFVLTHGVEMVVVGPEDPLVHGIVDYFAADEQLQKIAVVGPCKAGAQLEGSKDFAKAFMMRHNIPTARYQTFTADTIDQAYAFLETLKAPYVLKADGLAAGKGVLIVPTLEEAKQELKEMLGGMFGASSAKVVIEEFLSGVECSVFILTDGEHYKILPVAKDYKRVGDGDTGPNTGGMGNCSPVPFADETFMQKVEQRIIIPTVEGLRSEGIVYKGFIFFGLINVEGEPMVIEYNVRLGDPETEVILPRMICNFPELLMQAARGQLDKGELSISSSHAVTVVLTSGGYPGPYEKGKVITGLDSVQGSTIFHAGTALNDKGEVVTSGGRVLCITSLGDSRSEACNRSMKVAEQIAFEGKYYRHDIGADLNKIEQSRSTCR
jgi:phosphoribosylamine--glycine ligase